MGRWHSAIGRILSKRGFTGIRVVGVQSGVILLILAVLHQYLLLSVPVEAQETSKVKHMESGEVGSMAKARVPSLGGPLLFLS